MHYRNGDKVVYISTQISTVKPGLIPFNKIYTVCGYKSDSVFTQYLRLEGEKGMYVAKRFDLAINYRRKKILKLKQKING